MNRLEEIREGIVARNKVGQLYIIFGLAGALISIFIPVVAVVPLYCGYKLIKNGHSRLSGIIITTLGLYILLVLVLDMVGLLL